MWEIIMVYFQKCPSFRGKKHSKLHTQNLYKYITFILIEAESMWVCKMGMSLFYFNCLGVGEPGYQFPMKCTPCWGVLCLSWSLNGDSEILSVDMNWVTYNNTAWSNLNMLFSNCDKDNNPVSGSQMALFSTMVRFQSGPWRSTGLYSNGRESSSYPISATKQIE